MYGFGRCLFFFLYPNIIRIACTSLCFLSSYTLSFCLSLKLALATLTCFVPLFAILFFCQYFSVDFSFFFSSPFLLPLKSLMPVNLLLFTLSHPLYFSSDWLLRCSSRVTGLCGPWSFLALTACYLHGDGWLRRCRALLLTTAEDRAHTWDALPSRPLFLQFS